MVLLRAFPSFSTERSFKMDSRTLPLSGRSSRQKLDIGHPPSRHQEQRLTRAVRPHPEQPPSPTYYHNSPETISEPTDPANFLGPKSRRWATRRPDPSLPRRLKPRPNQRLRSNRHYPNNHTPCFCNHAPHLPLLLPRPPLHRPRIPALLR